MSEMLEGSCGHPTAPMTGTVLDYLTNFGHYTPRIYCMQSATGGPDWPWIIATIVLCAGVVIGYLRILFFWRRCYCSEAPADRNNKLMDLAWIFLWCAVCGYLTSVLMFFWPAYRLVVFCLVALNLWTWRFCLRLSDFSISFSAVRLQRQLRDELSSRNAELERLVAERTQELVRSRQAAAAANASKSEFLANMSHEIRTPMTAILGYAQLLGHDEQSRREAVDAIQRNGDHLLAIINDILDLSKIEAGKLTLERLETDALQIVDEVLSLLAKRAADKKITLTRTLAAPVPPTIICDPVRLRQILMNLVGNAIKFTQRGGVDVCVGGATRADGTPVLTFAVRDTGIGIDTVNIQRIFQPFEQADQGTTRQFGGTGLGLQICDRLIAMLGGKIAVQSELGSGSTFTVELPVTLPNDGRTLVTLDGDGDERSRFVPSTLTRNSTQPTLSGIRVLLAEDSPDSQRLFRRFLESAGAVVVIAGDGQAAVDIVRAESAVANDTGAPGGGYDVILMDMSMPVMDGLTATRLLRGDGVTTPILAFTAHAMPEEQERATSNGCDAVLSKPISRIALIRAVATWASLGSATATTE
ncbi:MAG: ATP-binding protein [Phycisphaerae bacterium]|nr:ATP-binding protein [Phycisphaerae bacterium]